ncbi:MAG TPA: serine/threonine-protein kinase [Polyangia bacterium]
MRTDGPPASRWLGLALVVIGVGLAAGGAYVRTSSREAASPPPIDTERVSSEARARVEQALGSGARAFEPTAASAARIPELIAALNMGADRATFQDLLESEEWWAKIRGQFPLNGVVTPQGALALLSPGSDDAAVTDAIRVAGDREVASGLIAGRGRAFLAATARVTRTSRAGEPTFVLVGAPVDHAALAKASEQTGDAIGLGDQAHLLEVAGPGEPGRVLPALLAQKDGGVLPLPDRRLGTSWTIGGGLRLLAAFSPPVAPPAPASGSPWLALVIAGAGAALLGIMTTAAGRSRSRAAGGRAPRQSSDPAIAPLPRAEGAPPEGGVEIRSGTPVGGRGGDGDGASDGRTPFAGGGSGGSAGPTPARVARPLTVSGSGADEPQRMTLLGSPVDPRGGASATAMATKIEVAPEPAPERISRGGNMGRYHLIDRIGEGGMAEIFFAVAHGAEQFKRHFVVKRMHPHIARNRVAVTQFIDEAQLQARLVHSNIVPVFDFGKAGDEYFLALEYIHGKDLQHVVQRHVELFGRPLDLPVAFHVMHEVLEGLSFAHSQTERDGRSLEVVHRDVSPGNVLVSYRGEVKLTDFGIAKSDKRVSTTEVGMVKGNAGFMSPEQARGDVVDYRSDLFSAGAVLHYCLTGHLLYDGETTMNRLLRAAVGPATAQFGQIDRLALPAAKVLRRALALEAASRYQSAGDFARDLSAEMCDRNQLGALMDQLFPPPERRDLG